MNSKTEEEREAWLAERDFKTSITTHAAEEGERSTRLCHSRYLKQPELMSGQQARQERPRRWSHTSSASIRDSKGLGGRSTVSDAIALMGAASLLLDAISA